MRSISWPADSVTEHTDVGEGRTDSGDASITSSEGTELSKFATWDTSGPSYDAQGVAHQRSTEMCQSVWLPPVAHTTTPWRMAKVYETGLLTRVVDPGVVVYYLRLLDHLFWRILCQIRNITGDDCHLLTAVISEHKQYIDDEREEDMKLIVTFSIYNGEAIISFHWNVPKD